jgi:hypothetical protein
MRTAGTPEMKHSSQGIGYAVTAKSTIPCSNHMCVPLFCCILSLIARCNTCNQCSSQPRLLLSFPCVICIHAPFRLVSSPLKSRLLQVETPNLDLLSAKINQEVPINHGDLHSTSPHTTEASYSSGHRQLTIVIPPTHRDHISCDECWPDTVG